MKRLNATEMAKMPEGTLFTYGGDETKGMLATPWGNIRVFYGGMTKHDTGSLEWLEADLARIDCDGSDDMHDKFYDMMEAGTAYPIEIEPSCGRHGLYPDNPIFFVFEPADLLMLSAIIGRALAVAEATMSNHERLDLERVKREIGELTA